MERSSAMPLPRGASHSGWLIRWLWPTRARVVVGLLVSLALWGWFDVRQRGTIDRDRPWIHKTDVTVYTEAGAAFFDGRDPYAVSNIRGWTYLYPPLFALCMAPLHAFDGPDQALVWFALNVFIAAGCGFEIVKLAGLITPRAAPRGMFGPMPNWLAAVALAAALLPALNCLQRGQVSLLKLYLLLLAFRWFLGSRTRRQAFLAGNLLALPIVLKLTPLLPVAAVLGQRWLGERRAATSSSQRLTSTAVVGTICGLAIYLLILPASLVGWRANLRHLDTWWTTVATRGETASSEDFAGDSTSKKNQSLSNAVRRLGNWASYEFAGGVFDDDPRKLPPDSARPIMESPRVDRLLFALRMGALALLVAVAWKSTQTGSRRGTAAVFALGCIATLVVAPIARAHYFVLWLPAIVIVSLQLAEAGRTRAAIWFAVTPMLLTIAHYVWIDGFGRIGLLGLGTAGWYAAACLTMVRLFSNTAPSRARAKIDEVEDSRLERAAA